MAQLESTVKNGMAILGGITLVAMLCDQMGVFDHHYDNSIDDDLEDEQDEGEDGDVVETELESIEEESKSKDEGKDELRNAISLISKRLSEIEKKM